MKGIIVNCGTGEIEEVDDGFPMPENPPLVEPEEFDLALAAQKLRELDAAKVKIADLEKATGIGGAGQKGIAQRIDNLEARIAALGG